MGGWGARGEGILSFTFLVSVRAICAIGIAVLVKQVTNTSITLTTLHIQSTHIPQFRVGGWSRVCAQKVQPVHDMSSFLCWKQRDMTWIRAHQFEREDRCTLPFADVVFTCR